MCIAYFSDTVHIVKPLGTHIVDIIGDKASAENILIPRLTEEVPNRSKRMKTLGNAVSPPQVFPILKYIADIETSCCPMGGEEL